jgi:hypothetical protein
MRPVQILSGKQVVGFPMAKSKELSTHVGYCPEVLKRIQLGFNMKFKDLAFSREYRLSIGVEEESGKYYLSIPVSNRLVDYEEYYELTKSEFDVFRLDMSKAIPFAEDCRRRKRDHLLMQKPGADRGIAN